MTPMYYVDVHTSQRGIECKHLGLYISKHTHTHTYVYT